MKKKNNSDESSDAFLESMMDIIQDAQILQYKSLYEKYLNTCKLSNILVFSNGQSCDDEINKIKKEMWDLYDSLNESNKLLISVEYGIPENPEGGKNG